MNQIVGRGGMVRKREAFSQKKHRECIRKPHEFAILITQYFQ
jgi:hypothetical protein